MDSNQIDPKTIQAFTPGQWLRLIITYLFFPLILFICSRDLRWWQGWVFSFLLFAVGIGARFWGEKRHPGLLAERDNFKSAAQAKPWDKVLAPIMGLSMSFPLVITAGLDHRYRWTAAFPIWLNLLGLLVVAGGYALASWAMAENRFFSGVVRIQTERGHTVCDTGPYRFIRHPGYAGNILPLVGIVLALSSLWTLIPSAAALIIAVVRTALEDKTLQEELPGYREYARRVRYRLFPGIY